MVSSQDIISLLNEALGQQAKIRKGSELLYFCPKCNHYKRKLEVHVNDADSKFGYFNCWVCGFKGKSFYSLLKSVNASRGYLDKLSTLLGDSHQSRHSNSVENDKKFILKLPDEFIPIFIKRDSFKYSHALSYLIKRGLTVDDILRYNIGYCEEGEYRNRIIIPSYDCNFQLNFFTSRLFYDGPMVHKTPPISKNIVGFESFINWSEDVNLVEGAFDAISVRRNTIPLFGKIIPPLLKEKIVKNGVKRVNVILDNDALKEAVYNVAELHKLGTVVHLIQLDGKDPSVLGFNKIHDLIRESRPFGFLDMITHKLKI